MNPNLNPNRSPSAPVRLYCRLVRTFSAAGPMSRHAETCADCRRYFQASAQLGAALRRDAVRFAPPPPAGLERGIMQAIQAAMPSSEMARTRSRPASTHAGWWAGISVAVAAVMALAVGLMHPPTSNPAQPNPSAGISVAENPAATTPTEESTVERLWNTFVPPAQKIATAEPLQDELDAVYSDTRSAIDFLALNFLPAEALHAQPAASGLGRG
jgi:hypothetical protein